MKTVVFIEIDGVIQQRSFDSPINFRVFNEMLIVMDDNNIVTLDKHWKMYVCHVAKLSTSGLKSEISKIIKADLIRRVKRGVYMVNPHYTKKSKIKGKDELQNEFYELKKG